MKFFMGFRDQRGLLGAFLLRYFYELEMFSFLHGDSGVVFFVAMDGLWIK
jgi:hypothetical protein